MVRSNLDKPIRKKFKNDVNLTYLRQALTELTSIEALGKKWPSVSLGAQVSESLSFIL